MCVRCGTGRVAACSSPDRHASDASVTGASVPAAAVAAAGAAQASVASQALITFLLKRGLDPTDSAVWRQAKAAYAPALISALATWLAS